MQKIKKKGQVSLYLVYIIVFIVVIFLTAFFAPLATLINANLYVAGERLILDANETISQISDATVKAEIQGILGTAQEATITNIEANAFMFQYGWVFILIIISLVMFLYSRTLVEFNTQRGGGFI